MNTQNRSQGLSSAVLAGLLLASMAVLAGGAALRESVTVDEVAHIGAGVSYLQKLDMRMNGEHPPLPKILAALPLVLRGVRVDYTHISWTVSEKFYSAFLGQWVFGEWLLEKWNDPGTLLVWARLPMLLVMLALGWTIYVCGRRLGGPWGGLLCLSLYVSSPVFLTFGPLVHTDLAVTLFSLLALWSFAELWRKPNRRHVLLLGLSLAAALLSKFTAAVLFVAFVIFALSLRWRPVPGQPDNQAELREWRRARWRATFKGVSLAALIVYGFYFVFSWHQSTAALYGIGTGPAALMVRRLLLPPFLYLRGVFWVLITGRRPTFILGHSYRHGVWFYFPVVAALKSPLGFLGLLVLSFAAAVRRMWRGRESAVVLPALEVHWRVVWVSLIVFTGVCLLSPLDISIRHFSVPLVLLILLLAPMPLMLDELRKQTRLGARLGGAAMVALAASCLFVAVRAYPYYFPFINSLSMGRPAYALVNDSNVDWNQSLREARGFAEQHGLQRVGLDEYGFSDATVSMPQARPWNCQTPTQEDEGQWVMLSSNMILDGHNCEWLLQYQHEALAGGSMYAVHLPAHIPAAGSAGGPPLPSAFREFVGAPFDIRGLFLHITQHPDDLPRAVQWMQTVYTTVSKSQGAPPKPPWEH